MEYRTSTLSMEDILLVDINMYSQSNWCPRFVNICRFKRRFLQDDLNEIKEENKR